MKIEVDITKKKALLFIAIGVLIVSIISVYAIVSHSAVDVILSNGVNLESAVSELADYSVNATYPKVAHAVITKYVTSGSDEHCEYEVYEDYEGKATGRLVLDWGRTRGRGDMSISECYKDMKAAILDRFANGEGNLTITGIQYTPSLSDYNYPSLSFTEATFDLEYSK
jgi:hypothetical protein